MCLLKIAEPVCELNFEQTKHRIAIVLASELTVLSYLNVSSVIPQGKRHFYPANCFGKTVNLYLEQSLFLISTVAMNNGSRKTTTVYYL